MGGSRKFCQRGSNSATLSFLFCFVFLLLFFNGERGSKYHYKRAIIDPPADDGQLIVVFGSSLLLST